MKYTGMVRKIDSLGRIVIPREIRSSFGIGEDTPLNISIDSERIVLQRYEPGCVFCGEIDGIRNISGKRVCRKCAESMVEAYSKAAK